MNFSGYFCLVAAAVLVVFSQQSEAITHLVPGNSSAFIRLRKGFSNGSQMLSRSRRTMVDGVLAAEKIIGKNPEGARKLTHQAFVDSISIIFTAGPVYNKALGGALGLSNDGARKGLLSGSKYIQKGGLALIYILNSCESLFNDGSEAGGRAAKALLDVYYLAAETGFAALFYDVEKSANVSLQALRDAQSSPIHLQVENRSCGVAAKDDPECSDALKDINQAAKNSLRNGANPALVQKLKEIVKCALDSIVEIATDAKRVVANIKTIAEIDTFAAATVSSEEAEGFEKRINQLFAQLYLDFGDVCDKFGNEADEEVQSGFDALVKANVIILNVIEFNEQIIATGLENGGDASMLAFKSVAKGIYYAKLVFIQSLAKFAKIVLTLL